MPDRKAHWKEVRSFLHKHLSIHDWDFSLPRGSGMETYFVWGDGQDYFVKVGAPVERYLAMAEIGLTPPVSAYGELEGGLTIMVQPFIEGWKPSQTDYRDGLEKVAELIRKMHGHPRVKDVLQLPSTDLYKEAGLRALDHLRQKWERFKARVPNVAGFVDNSLEYLAQQIDLFSGEGLVTSHNDICNANWLFASNGKIYVVDFESMSIDDPALDVGALLWWYYPPGLRGRFLDLARYPHNDEFKSRMQVRMAMHCLNITLPREQSFDSFDADQYGGLLMDFRALVEGRENPEGYEI